MEGKTKADVAASVVKALSRLQTGVSETIRGVAFAAVLFVAVLVVRDCGMATERDHFADTDKMVQPVERRQEDGTSNRWFMPEVWRSDLCGISVVGNHAASFDPHMPVQPTTGNGSNGQHNLHRNQDEMIGLASWYGPGYHGRRAGEQDAIAKGEEDVNSSAFRGLHLSVPYSPSFHSDSQAYCNTGEHSFRHVSLQYGYASWYGTGYHGRRTACGGVYDENELTAAHRTLACNTRVRVCRTDREACVVVTITDRGPFIPGRVVDLSRAAMERIGGIEAGLVPVTLEEMP